MRIAVVSDIHGNLAAFEAVLADLRIASPDLILHGGDLSHGGSSPAEIVDRIRDLKWPGVLGNTDEMLFDPDSLTAFASRLPQLESTWDAVAEQAKAAREALGAERIEWLRTLPRIVDYREMAEEYRDMGLVHASPESCWQAPGPEASDAELQSVYTPRGRQIAVYAHIHRPFVRQIGGLTVINTGSVSMSYDGDPRAAYLLLDDFTPSIRRVEYDVEREIQMLRSRAVPPADWIVKMLQTASPQVR
jgi:predicted phosphodiesterase